MGEATDGLQNSGHAAIDIRQGPALAAFREGNGRQRSIGSPRETREEHTQLLGKLALSERQESAGFAAPLPRRRNQPLPPDGAAGTAPGSTHSWETAAVAQTTKATAAALKPTKVQRPRSDLAVVMALAIPALGSVLADPLMSLVDTAFVGQTSNVALAALGPNTAIFNFVFQVFAFLGISTTAVLASHSPHAPGIAEEERVRRTAHGQRMLCYLLTIAIVLGVAVIAVLQAFGPSLLIAVGARGRTLSPALEYMRIRALAAPACLVMNVAQGACLGQQDAWTPLQAWRVNCMLCLGFDCRVAHN